MQTSEIASLQARINSIGTALFFCESNGMLPFPAYMITALKTDDEGYIWFFISRSWNKSVTYDLPFSTSLEFYRKGCPVSVSVKGKASLVNDKNIMHEFMQNLLGKSIAVKDDSLSDVWLVKVKIEHAECQELITKKTYSSLHTIFSGLKNILQPVHQQLQPSI